MHSVNNNVRVPATERLWMPARRGQVERHSDAVGAARRKGGARHRAADGPERRAAAPTLVADCDEARKGGHRPDRLKPRAGHPADVMNPSERDGPTTRVGSLSV